LCERLSALTEGNEVQCDSLTGFLDYGQEEGTCPDPDPASLETALVSTLRSLEQKAITAAIEAAEGNLSRAAKDLGISRTTLYRKCKKFE
jgi:transcriptional regulator of acetoin/glycerol metabolism